MFLTFPAPEGAGILGNHRQRAARGVNVDADLAFHRCSPSIDGSAQNRKVIPRSIATAKWGEDLPTMRPERPVGSVSTLESPVS